MQDVIHGSDHKPVLQLTNLVEGTYIFHLKVTDAKGDSDIDTATIEVRPGMIIKRSSISSVKLHVLLMVGWATSCQVKTCWSDSPQPCGGDAQIGYKTLSYSCPYTGDTSIEPLYPDINGCTHCIAVENHAPRVFLIVSLPVSQMSALFNLKDF